MKIGTLFVVATPIGNRDDLSPRARRVLGEATRIAAEDTRHTGRLLSHFGIDTPLIALHEHNEARRVPALIDEIRGGASLVLVSDAGTPLLSDPGFRLVNAAYAASIAVSPVPGASAVTSALSASGLPTDRFAFEGFLPSKRQARRSRLRELAAEPRTLVIFESVHRVRDAVSDLISVFGAERDAFVGRELTKLHEQCVRATLGELQDALESGAIPAKGEFVLVVGGAPEATGDGDTAVSAQSVLEALLPHLSGSRAVDAVVSITGANRNDVYRQMLALRDRSDD